MSKSQRTKGNAAELEVEKIVVKYLGGTCYRVPNSGGLVVKGDLVVEDNILEHGHSEVKRQERISLGAWMAQAEADAGGKWWWLTHRRSRECWKVTMKLEDWLADMAELQAFRAKEADDDTVY